MEDNPAGCQSEGESPPAAERRDPIINFQRTLWGRDDSINVSGLL
jgi:hypothetical protein